MTKLALPPAAQVARPYSRSFWRFVPPLALLAGMTALAALTLVVWLNANGFVAVALVGALTYFGVLALADYRASAHRLEVAWRQALTQLRGRALDDVQRQLVALERSIWIPPHGEARLLLIRGELERVRGDLDAAELLFSRALDSGWFAPDGPLDDALPEGLLLLARFAVVRGETREAQRWRRQLADLEKPVVSDRLKQALLLVIDALIDARCGDFEPLLRRLRAERPEVATTLDPADARLLDMLEEFARARSEPTGFRHEATSVALRWRPEEFIDLTPRWPELADFLYSRAPLTSLASIAP